MEVSRRQFIRGLVAAAAVVSLPPGVKSATVTFDPPLAVPALEPGNPLVSPDIMAKEALQILRQHLTFSKRHNIDDDRLTYEAHYRVPAHMEGPVRLAMPAGAMPVGNLRRGELVDCRRFVPELDYHVRIELQDDYEDMIPEIQDAMVARIEEHINAG